jgi:hypothetical protein
LRQVGVSPRFEGGSDRSHARGVRRRFEIKQILTLDSSRSISATTLSFIACGVAPG